MGSRSKVMCYSFAQEIGPSSLILTQQDRVMADVVRTAAGQRVVVGVVAEGQGGANANQAAGMVIEDVFQSVKATKERHLTTALREGLTRASARLVRTSENGFSHPQVAVAAVAVTKDRYYVAHCGGSNVFMVRRGRIQRVSRPDDKLLGGPSLPRIHTGNPQGHPLRSEDRLVLTSDGMMGLSPEDGKPYVDPRHMAYYVSRHSPNTAARHLISLALGRDVNDSVSVAVIGPLKPKGKSPLLVGALAAGVAALAFGVGIFGSMFAHLSLADLSLSDLSLRGLGLFRPSEVASRQVADFGYGVVVDGEFVVQRADGGVETLGRLSTIPTSTLVEAMTPARLALKSTYAGENEFTSLSLYLSSGTRLHLTAIDPRVEASDPGDLIPGGTTRVALGAGELLLVRRGGGQDYGVTFAGGTISLPDPGQAIVGVRLQAGRVVADCLAGVCFAEGKGGGEARFEAGQRVEVVDSLVMAPVDILGNEAAFWESLCGGCLPSGYTLEARSTSPPE